MDIAPNSHNLQSRVEYALANLTKNAPEISSRMSWHWTDVCMSTRFRRVAGMCRYWRVTDELRVELSEDLFGKMSEMDKTDTVVHELAHAVCFRTGLGKGHDSGFKRICKLMGGNGERLLKLEPGVVKRNLVKRWVLVKQSEPSKLHLHTHNAAENFKRVVTGALLLGVIQVDLNSKQVKWLSAVTADIRAMNPLQGKFQLVA